MFQPFLRFWRYFKDKELPFEELAVSTLLEILDYVTDTPEVPWPLRIGFNPS